VIIKGKIMKPIVRLAATVLLAIVVAGCGKKNEETVVEGAPVEGAATAEVPPTQAPAATAPAASAAPGNEVLPGASTVRASLERKDYEGAVGGLLALRGAATPGPQAAEYTTLYDEVKFALIDASLTDRKAAAALMTLRTATAGR
jgi:hypothetical protein